MNKIEGQGESIYRTVVRHAATMYGYRDVGSEESQEMKLFTLGGNDDVKMDE